MSWKKGKNAAQKREKDIIARNRAMHSLAMDNYRWWERTNRDGGVIIGLLAKDLTRLGKGETGIFEYLTLFPNIWLTPTRPAMWEPVTKPLRRIVNFPSFLVRKGARLLAKLLRRKIRYDETDLDVKAQFYRWSVLTHMGGQDLGLTPEEISEKLNIPIDNLLLILQDLVETNPIEHGNIPAGVKASLGQFIARAHNGGRLNEYNNLEQPKSGCQISRYHHRGEQ